MREYINYNPSNGEMKWKKIPSNRTQAGKPCGENIDSKGYKRVCFSGRQYRAHRVAWALFYGEEPKTMIDHINRDKTDNRIKNLRLASNAENSRNSTISRKNSSGTTGVTFHKAAKKWMAQIVVNKKMVYLGIFEKIEDAIAARRSAESNFFGQFSPNATA